MPTPDTLGRIKNVVRRSLKISAETPVDDLMPLAGGEYDLDSLDILLIVTELEKEFGIRITEDRMNRAAFTNVVSLGMFVEGMRQDV